MNRYILLGVLLFAEVVVGQVPTCNSSYLYRSFDGSCNNLNQPLAGTPGSTLVTPEGAEFVDGVKQPITVPTRPNERLLSNALLADDPLGKLSIDVTRDERRTGQNPDTKGFNNLFVIFGQFVSHDIAFTPLVFTGEGFIDNFGINITEPNDPLIQPQYNRYKLFTRGSQGKLVNGIYAPFTNVTAWLDLSTVYGSDEKVARGIRSFVGGKLKIGPSNSVPFLQDTNSTNECGIATPTSLLSAAGDLRVDENVGITSLHVLFLRKHNALASQLALIYPSWNDEKLYQEARKWLIAFYQNIVYKEYLPALLTSAKVTELIKSYTGYKPDTDVSLLNSFTTGALRGIGHDQLNLPLLVLDSNCQHQQLPTTQGVPTQERPNCVFDFFRAVGVDSIIRGLYEQAAQKVDHKTPDLMRNIIFNVGGLSTAPGNLDIEAANIFRGRENGVPNYNKLRQYWTGKSLYSETGCTSGTTQDPLQCFQHITSNSTLASLLRTLYKKVNNIDGIVGMLAEKKTDTVGPTGTAIIANQYRRLRDGDRFWYRNTAVSKFTSFDISVIESYTLADLINGNTGLSTSRAFYVPTQNSCFGGSSGGGDEDDGDD